MTGYEAEVIGRRLALHLRKNHFEGCRDILNYEERKLSETGPSTTIAELRIPLMLINILENNGYVYLSDMAYTNVFQLCRDLPRVRASSTTLICRVVSDAFRDLRANGDNDAGN